MSVTGVWHWNSWADVEFKSGGQLVAPNNGGKGKWTCSGATVTILWRQNGEENDKHGPCRPDPESSG